MPHGTATTAEMPLGTPQTVKDLWPDGQSVAAEPNLDPATVGFGPQHRFSV